MKPPSTPSKQYSSMDSASVLAPSFMLYILLWLPSRTDCSLEANFLPKLLLVIHSAHHSNRNSNWHRNVKHCSGWTWPCCFSFERGLWKHFNLWTGKANECWALNGLLCGSLKDKNVEENADDGGQACEVSEGNVRVPQRLYQGKLCDILYYDSMVSAHLGLTVSCD